MCVAVIRIIIRDFAQERSGRREHHLGDAVQIQRLKQNEAQSRQRRKRTGNAGPMEAPIAEWERVSSAGGHS